MTPFHTFKMVDWAAVLSGTVLAWCLMLQLDRVKRLWKCLSKWRHPAPHGQVRGKRSQYRKASKEVMWPLGDDFKITVYHNCYRFFIIYNKQWSCINVNDNNESELKCRLQRITGLLGVWGIILSEFVATHAVYLVVVGCESSTS